MDEFDIFTDEIKFSSPVYMDIVNKFKGCANTEHSGPNYQSSRKLCAEEYLAASDDINATFCLSESVSASLRILAVYREEQIKCTEWTIIQITAPYNPNENLKPYTEYREEIFSLYVSVMTNSYFDENIEPFTVQSVINIMDKEWLGSWKCLFMGKLIDTSLTDKIKALVDKTISDWGKNLDRMEKRMSAFVQYWCPDWRGELSKPPEPDIFLRYLEEADIFCCVHRRPTRNVSRNPMLNLDVFVAAAANPMRWRTGTRRSAGCRFVGRRSQCPCERRASLPRVLITSAAETLSKQNTALAARLPLTRQRMRWLNLSTGIDYASQLPREAAVRSLYLALGRNSERQSFVRCTYTLRVALLDRCVLRPNTYCGHGDGCQFACGGAGNAGWRARAAALLSGCGSVRLAHAGGRAPPAAAHHHYHIAGSPMVVGMLWEVTDLEVDKVVSTLLGAACQPRPLALGEHTNTEAKTPMQTERDLLRAVAKARRSTSFVMIASSVVARGLPLRIQE
ncbi:Separin [Eumeta japonica]|uniref:Separin n=1 Tax=Eumeta variegata TaxID=151549 RepID=A0A4C1SCK2_EUMVA|nr:Separin [Eumeta japonica]